MTVLKLLACEMNCETAGQKTDGEEDWRLQNLARSGSADAFPQVKEICDDKNREDGRLGDDEADHSDPTPIGKIPVCRSVDERTRDGAHFSILLLIATVRIFWVLQVPQGPAARNHRNGSKVVIRRRRTYRPFQSPGIPRIVAGFRSFEIRVNKIRDKDKYGDALNECADCDDQVQRFPTRARLVSVDAARHSENSGNVHDVECQVKPDQEEPEVELAKAFV